eukprot:COSAG06_NODE_26526_length_612_cov_690.877193_1_plen_31_part_01
MGESESEQAAAAAAGGRLGLNRGLPALALWR